MTWSRISPQVNANTSFDPQLYTDLLGAAIEDEENEGFYWIVDVFDLTAGTTPEWVSVDPSAGSNWTEVQP